MIYKFSQPAVEITEIDRRKGDVEKRFNNTGLIFLTKQCHACGMENVESLSGHDVLNPSCPWSLFRSSTSFCDSFNKKSIIHIICPIHSDVDRMIESCFFMFSCRHIVCIPCAMSLMPFRCPFCREEQNDNSSSSIVHFQCG